MLKSILYLLVVLLTIITYSQEQLESESIVHEQGYISTLDENTETKLKNKIIGVASKNTDSIKIFSVLPNKNLIHGDIHTVVVIVAYNLTSKEQGVLKIGFNSGMDYRAFKMDADASKIISKDCGHHVFIVKTRAINWEKEGKVFYAYTNLSEFPHPKQWNPLSADRFLLKFKE